MGKKDAAIIRTTVRLPETLMRRVKHWCVDHDTSFQDAVTKALEQLTKEGKS